jgi:heat shock protein HslJ
MIRLSFPEKSTLGLYAGCNHLAGDFSIEDERLVSAGLGTTDIGCQAELHAQDEWLSAFIEAGPRLALKGDRLTLEGKDATLEFLDREIASPDRPLVGTDWEVDTFIKNGGAGNFPLARPPTLRFDAQGKVQVFTGCNEGSGSYEQKGERLVFSAIQYTEKACADAAGVEEHVQAVVSDGEVSIEIEELRLTLMRGELGLGAVAPN